MSSPWTATRREALLTLAASSLWWSCRGAAPLTEPSVPEAKRAAMLAAVQSGDAALVRNLLEEDPRLVGVTDAAGRSCLVLACLAPPSESQVEIRAALLAMRAPQDCVEAVLAEDWERFEALAEQHPEQCNALHAIGGTPLHAAALVGQPDLYRLRSVGCDSDANPKGGCGYTPARFAFEGHDPNGIRIAVTDLLSNGGEVNAPQKDGDSILHAAFRTQDMSLIHLVLRKGGDPEAVDAQYRTPLDVDGCRSREQGDLVAFGQPVSYRDDRSSRCTVDGNFDPIVMPDLADVPQAVQSEVTSKSHFNLKAVQDLVARDARLVFSLSTDDELPIEACAHTGNRPIIRYHLDQGAPLSLPTAVSLGDLTAARRWLEIPSPLPKPDRLQAQTSRVHDRGAHDFPLFWYAPIGGDDVAMAELLLEYGASVDQESLGNTALHWCVVRERKELAHWLIEQGADLSPVGLKWDRRGQTPLQLAQAKNKPEMAKLLRAAGARS